MLKLVSWLELWLPKQPEYRMGYQKVIATLNTGGRESGIVINSEVFLKGTDYPWQMLRDWDYIKRETEKSALVVTDVTLIPREPETLKGVRHVAIANEKFHVLAERTSNAINSAYGSQRQALLSQSVELAVKAASASADDAPITLTALGDIFKRFSAYVNDKRVTAGKGLQTGTFGTTKDDADVYVKTGADAVSRYALPNSKPATNVFTISPPKDTDLKRGTAQPAYDQPGGGVEVIFVNGSPDGTVSGPTTIPEK